MQHFSAFFVHYCDMTLKELRKAQKVKVKDIPLHPATVKAIEDEKGTPSIKALQTYCQSIGIKIIFSL